MEADVDTKLLAADTTLIFAFSFARTLCAILLSPEFPGWLAPVDADPIRLATTFGFAGSYAVLWVGAALALGSFAPGVDEESVNAVGVGGALRCFGLAATAYCVLGLVLGLVAGDAELVPAALRLSVDNVEAVVGEGAALVAWRSLLADSIPR